MTFYVKTIVIDFHVDSIFVVDVFITKMFRFHMKYMWRRVTMSVAQRYYGVGLQRNTYFSFDFVLIFTVCCDEREMDRIDVMWRQINSIIVLSLRPHIFSSIIITCGRLGINVASIRSFGIFNGTHTLTWNACRLRIVYATNISSIPMNRVAVVDIVDAHSYK